MSEANGLMFLIDRDVSMSEDRPDPPVDAVLGVWSVDARGRTGLFRPNPWYRPRSPRSPTDPVDAVLRDLAAANDVPAEALPSVLLAATLTIGVGDDDTAVVRAAPDGHPCVLVATARVHQAPDVSRWVEISVPQLARALPPDGVDVLLNPASPVSIRLRAQAVRTMITAPLADS